MKLRLPRFAATLFDVRSDLRKLAIGGAWLFAVGSLFPLAWLIWFSNGGFLAVGHVFSTHINGQDVTMPLLSYSGLAGFLLIWSQVLLVSAAILLAAFPRYVPLRWRRLGHAMLAGWNTLWVIGAWKLAWVDPSFLMQSLFLTALLACTMYRAFVSWTPRRVLAAPVNAESPAARDSQSPNYFSDEAEQPPTGTARQQILQALECGRQTAVAASRKAVVAFKAGINAARDHSAKT